MLAKRKSIETTATEYLVNDQFSLDLDNWSFTSASNNSIMTPSPEPQPKSLTSSGENTLASSLSLELLEYSNSSTGFDSFSDNIGVDSIMDSPTVHIAKKTSAQLTASITQSIRTPEKLYQVLRPSGSPTRVSGSKVVADVNFTDADSRELCKVDKSLVCKGFWESIEKVGRICLPRRSGKTYNLTQMLLFFSMMPEAELLDTISDSVIDNGGLNGDELSNMSLSDKCRKKREWLFDGSLLKTMDPLFYQTHFMKYPVLHISLSGCEEGSLGGFIVNICECIATVAANWLDHYHT
ncbi:hypothetical protein GGI07_004945, partial [Coemansia sp. Benny D115]